MRIFIDARDRLARVRGALGFAPRSGPSAVVRAGRARLRVADALDDRFESRVVAAVLYRDVLALVAAGREDAEHADDADDADDADGAEAPSAPSAAAGSTSFDSLEPAELERAVGDLRERAHVAVRAMAPPAWWQERRARTSVAALAMLAALVVALAWARPFAARNLALTQRVTASSVQAGHDPATLVDGERGNYQSVDAVTVPGRADPWMTVDLGSVVRIRRIVVCNRGDRDMDAGLPYALDLSDDGTTFREVTRRTEHFGDGTWFSPPWTVKLDARARFVRVRAHDYVALSELEVY